MAASVVDYSNVARPYRPLSSRAANGIVAALFLPLLVISFAFALAGAWLVLPFAGLELLLLACALRYVRRHANDYQSITIDRQQLTVENRQLDHTSQHVFHPYWTQVVLRPAAGELRLWLRSHGNEVEVGRYLNHEQRLDLAHQLKLRTGSFH